MSYLFQRLLSKGKLNRVVFERLTEPLHLNAMSPWVAAFGSLRQKILFDLVVRQQNAFCMLKAADFARELGLRSISVCEFGVAAGAGLLNMCELGRRITEATGVEFMIYGFDTGTGMPKAVDYRDQPEAFREGDFPMGDFSRLRASLPKNAELIIGNVADTVREFRERLTDKSPLAFVSIDVDYYSSSKVALDVFCGDAGHYLPMTLVWLDDIGVPSTNPWVGELLAVREFNEEQPLRKIHPYTFLRSERLFTRTKWLDQVYVMHTLDHSERTPKAGRANAPVVLDNPYLR